MRKHGQGKLRYEGELSAREVKLDTLKAAIGYSYSKRKSKIKITLPRVSIQEAEDLEAHDRWRKT